MIGFNSLQTPVLHSGHSSLRTFASGQDPGG